MKRTIVFLMVVGIGLTTLYADNIFAMWRGLMRSISGNPTITNYSDILTLEMGDGCHAYFTQKGDTIYCIETVCAPVCSSVVKAYDKNWNYVRDVKPTIPGTFVQAFFDGDQNIIWEDNTAQLSDSLTQNYFQ